MIVAMTGSRSEIVFTAAAERRPRQRQPDIALAQRELGWQPTVALRDGLVKTIAYFRDLVAAP